VPEISEPLAVIRSLLAASKGAGAADVMRHFQGEPVRNRCKGVRWFTSYSNSLPMNKDDRRVASSASSAAVLSN
jgi:hypothetical protein